MANKLQITIRSLQLKFWFLKQKLFPTVNLEDMVDWIHCNNGVDYDVIEDVLDLEMQYLEEQGIVNKIKRK